MSVLYVHELVHCVFFPLHLFLVFGHATILSVNLDLYECQLFLPLSFLLLVYVCVLSTGCWSYSRFFHLHSDLGSEISLSIASSDCFCLSSGHGRALLPLAPKAARQET